MKKQLNAFLLLLLLVPAHLLQAQPAERKMTAKEYIEKFKEDAVREMLIAGVPASITLAQGMLESGNGNSALAVYANNHFGIKCHTDWTGETYIQDDDEKNECFRKYPAVYDSYLDHSTFLRSRQRYAFLFDLKITDYKGWARGLKQAGYATDPRYADRLIELIEQNKLNDLDKVEGATSKPVDPKQETKPVTVATAGKREVHTNNGVKYIIAKKGDTFAALCKELGLAYPELFHYNELSHDAVPQAGQMLYIQSKKRKGNVETHTVKPGETMHEIAQLHGMRLKSLYRKNHMKRGDEPKPGDVLNLQKKKK